MVLVVVAVPATAGLAALCPPCAPAEAAALALACFGDTVDVVGRCAADRRLLVVADGVEAPVEHAVDAAATSAAGRFDVARLRRDDASAVADRWTETGGAALVVGTDVPQLTVDDLDRALERLAGGAPAAVGATSDGGWWASGFGRPAPQLLPMLLGGAAGAPASAIDVVAACRSLDLTVSDLPARRRVGSWPDALAVAGEAPATRFAAAVRSIAPEGVEGRHH